MKFLWIPWEVHTRDARGSREAKYEENLEDGVHNENPPPPSYVPHDDHGNIDRNDTWYLRQIIIGKLIIAVDGEPRHVHEISQCSTQRSHCHLPHYSLQFYNEETPRKKIETGHSISRILLASEDIEWLTFLSLILSPYGLLPVQDR